MGGIRGGGKQVLSTNVLELSSTLEVASIFYEPRDGCHLDDEAHLILLCLRLVLLREIRCTLIATEIMDLAVDIPLERYSFWNVRLAHRIFHHFTTNLSFRGFIVDLLIGVKYR